MTKVGKRVLILSDGPVPTPEHNQVEGGGLRCWGLANGVKTNDPSIDVTVAYNKNYVKPGFTDMHQDIHIKTWTLDDIRELIDDYDTVIVSYCMGDLSVKVAAGVRVNQQLILDCYVPIYIEVSARGSNDVEGEFRAFEVDVQKWQQVLKRGDVFMCANDAQKKFYQGVLAAVGRINPVTYADDLIEIVPYGIYRDDPVAHNKPITELLGKDTDVLKVLWFGGIYPWFDVRNLADAVKRVNETQKAKLIVVGAKNPFNKHPDFIARYEEFMKYVSTEEMKQYVIVQDWIDFNDRADWYLDADLVVVFNKEGEENKLAWRTRLVDFMWADLPVLTNGGDPLGEAMLENKAAIKIDTLESADIAKSIIGALDGGKSKLEILRNNMNRLKTNYYWDTVTKNLVTDITEASRARDLVTMGMYSTSNSQNANAPKIRRVINKAKKVPAYANKYGYKATGMVIGEMVKRKLKSRGVSISERKKPAYVFVSHQLDMSGGAFIAMDMAMEFQAAGKSVEFYTYLPTHNENLKKLNKAGIKPHILMNKDMVPSFMDGDTLILNTVAHSEVVKESVFTAVETGRIKQVIWYLHEDDPGMQFRPDEQRRIKKMLQAGQMKMLIAAKKMLDNYKAYFETSDNIVQQPYRHIVPAKYHRQLKAADFKDKLTFVLPGTVGDGRKGQLPILYAFIQFYEQYYKKAPENYRDFELVFIGVSDDFLSRQIVMHASSLDDHFSSHGRVTWEQDLDIVAQCNVTICYSIRECLPLFVFEGMISGHVLLRNDCSGMEEQLVNGENGYLLASEDFEQVVHTLQTVLSKATTSDDTLAAMSRRSYDIAKMQETHSYLASLNEGKES